MRHGRTRSIGRLFLMLTALGCSPASAAEGSRDAWTLPDDRLGVRTAPLLLLSRKDVRDELKLSKELAAEVDEAILKFFEKASTLRGKSGAEIAAARSEIDRAQDKWIESKLNEQQRLRLAQIDLQWEGPSAILSRPAVEASLSLSQNQRRRLSRAIFEKNSELRSGERDAIAANRVLAESVLTILDAPRLERWRAMLGKPFEPRLAASRPRDAARR